MKSSLLWEINNKGELMEGKSRVCIFNQEPDNFDLKLMRYAPLWPELFSAILIQGLDGIAAGAARSILAELDKVS